MVREPVILDRAGRGHGPEHLLKLLVVLEPFSSLGVIRSSENLVRKAVRLLPHQTCAVEGRFREHVSRAYSQTKRYHRRGRLRASSFPFSFSRLTRRSTFAVIVKIISFDRLESARLSPSPSPLAVSTSRASRFALREAVRLNGRHRLGALLRSLAGRRNTGWKRWSQWARRSALAPVEV